MSNIIFIRLPLAVLNVVSRTGRYIVKFVAPYSPRGVGGGGDEQDIKLFNFKSLK